MINALTMSFARMDGLRGKGPFDRLLTFGLRETHSCPLVSDIMSVSTVNMFGLELMLVIAIMCVVVSAFEILVVNAFSKCFDRQNSSEMG